METLYKELMSDLDYQIQVNTYNMDEDQKKAYVGELSLRHIHCAFVLELFNKLDEVKLALIKDRYKGTSKTKYHMLEMMQEMKQYTRYRNA